MFAQILRKDRDVFSLSRHTTLPKLGSGWQYSVYMLTQSRVIKYKLPFLVRLSNALFRSAGALLLGRISFLHFLIKTKLYGLDLDPTRSLLEIKKDITRINRALLGNPYIFENGDYFQDTLVPCGDYFFRSDEREQKKMIDGFIKLTHLLWSHGLCEISFKIMKNFGINQRGDVVLSDLGEITFDIQDAIISLGEYRWERDKFFKKIPPSVARYYLDQIAKHLTKENLILLWGKKIVSNN